MRIRIICLTQRGAELGSRLADALHGHETEICYKHETPLSDLCSDAFAKKTAIVFIGAMGIAVRLIAPYVRDKLTDPPVIVMDEMGLHVIPVLSGHMGGANALALKISAATGADPVITTATDINGAFAVDLFAKENGLRIADREGIARVSSSALSGRSVTITIKDYPPAEPVDVIISDDSGAYENLASIRLCPGKYAVGIGCRRGKSFEEILKFAELVLDESGIDPAYIGAVATIDIKADETGIRALAEYWKVPVITYEASVLARARGEFTSSDFVREKVGVDNVSERAAVLAAGPGSRLVIHKQAANGITIAAAERKI
ncbi:MAG: cobalt-precorrin 5A hydrolase [Mogibacterium sp.]|nr:cobalt-precorrin 5A hydrolase [Mogibacterium sp.]